MWCSSGAQKSIHNREDKALKDIHQQVESLFATRKDLFTEFGRYLPPPEEVGDWDVQIRSEQPLAVVRDVGPTSENL